MPDPNLPPLSPAALAMLKQQQQAQTPQNLMAAVTAAKGLSETSMVPGSALSALTGGGNPAAPAGG